MNRIFKYVVLKKCLKVSVRTGMSQNMLPDKRQRRGLGLEPAGEKEERET
jgi:hypothetical protein